MQTLHFRFITYTEQYKNLFSTSIGNYMELNIAFGIHNAKVVSISEVKL